MAEQYAVVKSDAAVSSDILKGRKVQILARSTKDRKEKQDIGDLVTSMGGTVCASVPKAANKLQAEGGAPAGPQTMDLVIAGSADPKGYARDLATHQKDKGTEYDVLAAQWLEVCRERGRVVEPLPRHYRHVCDLTLERLADLDGYDVYVSTGCLQRSFMRPVLTPDTGCLCWHRWVGMCLSSVPSIIYSQHRMFRSIDRKSRQ